MPRRIGTARFAPTRKARKRKGAYKESEKARKRKLKGAAG